MDPPRATAARLRCALTAASVALAACAGNVTAQGVVVKPADLDVRSHPSILVASTDDDLELGIATELALHLDATGPNAVAQVHVGELEPRRLTGGMPAAGVVVLVELRLDRETRAEWASRPETVCGPVTCYTTTRSYLRRVPEVRGELVLTLYDAPSARVLDRRAFRAAYEGTTPVSLERRVAERLGRLARDAVDARRLLRRVRLSRFDGPEADRALDAIARGDWAEGRALLETLVTRPAFTRLGAPERARGWYALGQARRFDPSTIDDFARHFDAAREALVRARELDPRREHEAALEDLDEHRRMLERLAEQRARARARFDYARTVTELPEPPASYRTAPPVGAPR